MKAVLFGSLGDMARTKLGKKVPLGAVFLTTVGVVALVRGFWNPNRAVIKDGFATQCEGGKGCSNYTTLESAEGSGPVYAAARGMVVKATDDSVFIVPNREAVVLEYKNVDQVMVRPGQTVWNGQQIGTASTLQFAVYRINRSSNGAVTYVPLSPSAWLASRGARLSAKKSGVSAEGENWCEGGRRLTMPEKVGQCGLRLPEPTAVALLPVTVTMG